MIKNLILDFDGTLADTRQSIVGTIQETLKEIGYTKNLEKEIQENIELPVEIIFEEVANLDKTQLKEAVKLYYKKYTNNCYQTVTLYSNVATTLKDLYEKNICITVMSNKGKDVIRKLLSQLKIDSYTHWLMGDQGVRDEKLSSNIVEEFLGELQLHKLQTLVVGDAIDVIQMGQNAGCLTCAVTYGNHTLEQMIEYQPNYIINDFIELKSIM